MNFGELFTAYLAINLSIIALITFFITTIGYFTVKLWSGLFSGVHKAIEVSPVVVIVLLLSMISAVLLIGNNPEVFSKKYKCKQNILGYCIK